MLFGLEEVVLGALFFIVVPAGARTCPPPPVLWGDGLDELAHDCFPCAFDEFDEGAPADTSSDAPAVVVVVEIVVDVFVVTTGDATRREGVEDLGGGESPDASCISRRAPDCNNIFFDINVDGCSSPNTSLFTSTHPFNNTSASP